MLEDWKLVRDSNIKYFFLIIVPLLLIEIHVNTQLLVYFQQRQQHVSLYDPILGLIPAKNVTQYLIFLTDFGFLTALAYLLRYPQQLLTTLIAFMLMLAFRWLTLYLLPLQSPIDTIPLRDTIVYGSHVITRDLFFSGHTATYCIFVYIIPNFKIRIFLMALLFIIISLLLIGHEHYCLDIVSAPVFAYFCYRVAKKMTGNRYDQYSCQ